MDQLRAMRVFVAVVEAKGFSAASRELCMSLPTVCRKVSELEDYLGAQLLNRTTRIVTPTDSGLFYYREVKRILDDLSGVDHSASGEFLHAKGLLNVTAPALFGQLFVLPLVNEFMKFHSEIEFRLLFSNQLLDISHEHIDLGIRIGSLMDKSMASIQVGHLRMMVCASPDYLSVQGQPISPYDITKHQLIKFSGSGSQARWQFKTRSGRTQLIATKPRLIVNTEESAVESALQGLGLVQLYSYQAAQHVASGRLEIVLAPYEIAPVPVYILFPHSQRLPQKIRLFVEFILPVLQEALLKQNTICYEKNNK